MKKLLVFSLMIALLFSLVACDLEQAQGERLGIAYYNAHGGTIAAAAAVVDADGKILAASLDDLFMVDLNAGYVGLPSATDAKFVGNLKVATKTLGSKKHPVNSGIYGASMAAKAGSTVLPADNLAKIQAFAVGKTIAQLEKYMDMEATAAKADIQAASGATFADNQDYLRTILLAAKNAQQSKNVFHVADPANVVIGQAYYNSHPGGPTNAYVVVEGDVVVKSLIDDLNFFDKNTNTIIPLSEAKGSKLLGDIVDDGAKMLLGSKKFNVDAAGVGIYGARMTSGNFNDQIAKVEKYADGKTAEELAAASDALFTANVQKVVTGATMTDTKHYLKALAIAAKSGYAVNDPKASHVKLVDVASFGMGYVPSAAKDTTAQVTSTVLAAAFDAEGKVVKAVINVIQPDKNKTSQPSKNELGYKYGMIKAAALVKKEWHEQAMALTKWMEGKTVSEIVNMETYEKDPNHKFVPNVADLKTSVSIDVADYFAALQEAYDTAKPVANATGLMGVNVGLDLTVKIKEFDAEKNLQAYDVYMTAVLTDAPGTSPTAYNGDKKILAAVMDVAQQKVTLDADGKVVDTAVLSKLELGPDYGMKAGPNNKLGKEWDEQSNAFTDFIVGKNIAEVTALTSADLASTITVGMDSYFASMKKAVNFAF